MNLNDDAHVDLVRKWIAELEAGGDAAVAHLMNATFDRLLHIAGGFLKGSPQGAADADDLVQSAFWSFVCRARLGSFPEFDSVDQLWRILKCFVRRKAAKRRYREARVQACQRMAALATVSTRRVTSSELTIQREELEVLLGSLSNDMQRAMVRMRGEGHTNEEIAQRFAITVRSVERNFAEIREILLRRRKVHSRTPCSQ